MVKTLFSVAARATPPGTGPVGRMVADASVGALASGSDWSEAAVAVTIRSKLRGRWIGSGDDATAYWDAPAVKSGGAAAAIAAAMASTSASGIGSGAGSGATMTKLSGRSRGRSAANSDAIYPPSVSRSMFSARLSGRLRGRRLASETPPAVTRSGLVVGAASGFGAIPSGRAIGRVVVAVAAKTVTPVGKTVPASVARILPFASRSNSVPAAGGARGDTTDRSGCIAVIEGNATASVPNVTGSMAAMVTPSVVSILGV